MILTLLSRQSFASVPVAFDPFDKKPRLIVKSLDGVEVSEHGFVDRSAITEVLRS